MSRFHVPPCPATHPPRPKAFHLTRRFCVALFQRLVPHAGKPVEGLLEDGWQWLHWDGSSWTAQPAATAGGAQ